MNTQDNQLHQQNYTIYIEHCFSKIMEKIMIQSFDEYIQSIPTFYYMAIGSANPSLDWPPPNNRQEYPDYVKNYSNERKVLILIDYQSKKPLDGSPHELILIDSINITIGTNNQPVYEYYHSVEKNNLGYPKLEVHVIRQYIELLEYAFNAENEIQIYVQHRKMLVDLVEFALSINNKSLFLVNSFNGYQYYRVVDEILSLFPFDKQDDMRSRFLLEGTYNADHGCYYDLTDINNQPIIDENGHFYNPGSLSIAEYDNSLKELFEEKKVLSETQFNIKQKIMLKIFNNLLSSVLNSDYRTFRCAINEMKKSDPELMPFLREEMLQFVEKALQMIRSYVDIPTFIEKQRNSDIYSDETEIKKLINNIMFM